MDNIKDIIFYFLSFILSGFFGFILETLWCLIKNKRIKSRKGLIYEPIIPIYAIAGLLLTIMVKCFELKKINQIFFLGIIISIVVEYISSYVQEKIFHSKSWDYSGFPLNINGRIDLIYCVLFGIGAVMWYLICYSTIVDICNFINIKILIFLSIITLILFIYDCIISALSVIRVSEIRKNIVRKGKIWSFIDKYYPEERVTKTYANMKFI